MVRQLYSPVRWTESVQYYGTTRCRKVAELGPGKVLTGLTKRIVKTLSGSAVNDVASLEAASLGKRRIIAIMMNLKAKVALVTGASRGIGLPLQSFWLNVVPRL